MTHTSICRTKVIIQCWSTKGGIPSCCWNICIVCTISTLCHSAWISHIIVLCKTESKNFLRHKSLIYGTHNIHHYIWQRKWSPISDSQTPITNRHYPRCSTVNNYHRTIKLMRLCHYGIHRICSFEKAIYDHTFNRLKSTRWNQLLECAHAEHPLQKSCWIHYRTKLKEDSY